jgi:hypothetical protein
MSGTSLVELTERLRRPGLLLRCLVTLVAVACATAVSVIMIGPKNGGRPPLATATHR